MKVFSLRIFGTLPTVTERNRIFEFWFNRRAACNRGFINRVNLRAHILRSQEWWCHSLERDDPVLAHGDEPGAVRVVVVRVRVCGRHDLSRLPYIHKTFNHIKNGACWTLKIRLHVLWTSRGCSDYILTHFERVQRAFSLSAVSIR